MPGLRRRPLALVSSLLLIGAGCAGPAATGGPSAATPAARASECDNPYYPLTEGHSITYGMRVGGRDSSVTMTVTSASATGATVAYGFDGRATATQEITCAGGTIAARGYVDFGAAISGMEARTETRSSTGVLMPERIVVGATWDSAMQTAATMNLPPEAAAMFGGSTEIVSDIATHREAIAEEEVTVPAGTYRAIKVKTKTTITTTGGPGAGSPSTAETTEWFVRDVGMVKSLSADGTVMEATSVTQ